MAIQELLVSEAAAEFSFETSNRVQILGLWVWPIQPGAFVAGGEGYQYDLHHSREPLGKPFRGELHLHLSTRSPEPGMVFIGARRSLRVGALEEEVQSVSPS